MHAPDFALVQEMPRLFGIGAIERIAAEQLLQPAFALASGLRLFARDALGRLAFGALGAGAQGVGLREIGFCRRGCPACVVWRDGTRPAFNSCSRSDSPMNKPDRRLRWT